MNVCECDFIGASDLMFGCPVMEKKRDDETHEQHEERTWTQKVNVAPDGQLFIQPFALKNALESAAGWLKKKIPGEGQATYKKRFVSGVMVVDKMLLTDLSGNALTIDDVVPRPLFVPSDGKRGSSKRVTRIFPTISEWKTHAEIHVFDTKLSGEIVEKHLIAAGKFVGFGSMRVENGGINGRFAVENFQASELEQVAA